MNLVPEIPARVLLNCFSFLSALLVAFIFWMMSWQHFIASRPLCDGALATQVGGFGRDGEGAGATGKISLRYEGINSPALPDITRSDDYNVFAIHSWRCIVKCMTLR